MKVFDRARATTHLWGQVEVQGPDRMLRVCVGRV